MRKTLSIMLFCVDGKYLRFKSNEYLSELQKLHDEILPQVAKLKPRIEEKLDQQVSEGVSPLSEGDIEKMRVDK